MKSEATLSALLLWSMGIVPTAATGILRRHLMSSHKPLGLQMGPEAAFGDPIASAVTQGPTSNTVLIAGSTHGPTSGQQEQGDEKQNATRCFLGVLDVSSMTWDQLEHYGLDGNNDTLDCSNLQREKDHVILAGHGQSATSSYGTLLSLKEHHQQYNYTSGLVLSDEKREEDVDPISLTSHRGCIYMAGLTSHQGSKNSKGHSSKEDGLIVGAYEMNQDGSLESIFTERFSVGSTEDLHVAGMMLKSKGEVVVAGQARSQGGVFGESGGAKSDSLGGFVTKLDGETGKLVPRKRVTLRIESEDGGDHELRGLCHDDSDTHHVYVVGASFPGSSENAKQEAMIAKVDLLKMRIVWEKRIGLESVNGTDTIIRATSCTVTPDGKTVWWGGNVYGGGAIENHTSFGGTDIFISQLTVGNGAEAFIRQFGSQDNDTLASHGGLTTDEEGNLVVVGNTFGSLYRAKADEAPFADTFVATVSRDTGDIAPTYGSNNGAHRIILLTLTAVFAAYVAFLLVRRGHRKEQEESYQVKRVRQKPRPSLIFANPPEGFIDLLEEDEEEDLRSSAIRGSNRRESMTGSATFAAELMGGANTKSSHRPSGVRAPYVAPPPSRVYTTSSPVKHRSPEKRRVSLNSTLFPTNSTISFDDDDGFPVYTDDELHGWRKDKPKERGNTQRVSDSDAEEGSQSGADTLRFM